MTIQYRGNTLNSKVGYYRSVISRLALPEEEEDAPSGRNNFSRMEDVANPKGLNMLSQVSTNGKRKEILHRDNQPRQKREER